jgi:hypothetical protein
MCDSLIFFERTSVGADGVPMIVIAVAEQESTAKRLESQRFRRCSYAEFRAAWRARDALACAQEIRSYAASPPEPAPQEIAAVRPFPGARIYPMA